MKTSKTTLSSFLFLEENEVPSAGFKRLSAVKPYYTTTTRIVGVFFGGVEGTTITGFSEIDGIFRELGNMEVAYNG